MEIVSLEELFWRLEISYPFIILIVLVMILEGVSAYRNEKINFPVLAGVFCSVLFYLILTFFFACAPKEVGYFHDLKQIVLVFFVFSMTLIIVAFGSVIFEVKVRQEKSSCLFLCRKILPVFLLMGFLLYFTYGSMRTISFCIEDFFVTNTIYINELEQSMELPYQNKNEANEEAVLELPDFSDSEVLKWDLYTFAK